MNTLWLIDLPQSGIISTDSIPESITAITEKDLIHTHGILYVILKPEHTGRLTCLAHDWSIISLKPYSDCMLYVLERFSNPFDIEYSNLLTEVSKQVLRNSRNARVHSLFCKHLSFDLTNGFPLLTTKRMFWKGIVEEFLFFIQGQTDTQILEEKGVKIWAPNTSREFLDGLGMHNRPEKHMGPMYGYQWRFFNAPYDEKTGKPKSPGVDQFVNLIRGIRNDPGSRRHLLTDYNPCQVQQGVLYPCHSLIIQFYVNQNQLDMFCYNRSSDVFLGLPFNIASSSLLLSLVAYLTKLVPGKLHLSLGDCHVYEQHYSAVNEQLLRVPWKPPQLTIRMTEHSTIEDTLKHLKSSDFILSEYSSHDAIRAPMIP